MTNIKPKQRGLKINTQTSKVVKIEYQKYLVTSAKVRYVLPKP